MSKLDELIENPPVNCENVRDLYTWSTNYDYETGTPFMEYLDLIGYSDNEFGEKMNKPKFEVDYESAYQLGLALVSWSMRPEDVNNYVTALMEAERVDA
jgi:hypothetical protein